MIILQPMTYYESYLNSAKQILHQYDGRVPFSSFLKKYFAEHKKFGSKDRKQVSHLCYCFFRLGKTAMDLSTEERIGLGLFLCSTEPNGMLAYINAEWDKKTGLTIEEKFAVVYISLMNVFPWKHELSETMDNEKFCKSFFVQPALFLRIRPGQTEKVLSKLNSIGIEYEFIQPFTVRLPNSFKADKYFELDNEIVIQDHSSQQIARFLPTDHEKKVITWDCCAASGGKSIMAYDINPNIDLTVSDIRESILVNLKKRFTHAGIKKYKTVVVDLASSQLPSPGKFDLIIADVPCTGSGTWSRTPEQLFYFDKSKIDEYVLLQRKIISNVIASLKPGGYLLYITCSVFKKENEENVSFINENLHLDTVKMEMLKGYDNKADTLFAALVRRPL